MRNSPTGCSCWRGPTSTRPRSRNQLPPARHEKTEGVTVRPLVLMNGHAHFNEVFFEDARVPKQNLVGPLNEGWKVAMTTLMFERGVRGRRRPRIAGTEAGGTRAPRKDRRPSGLGKSMDTPAARAVRDRMRGRQIHAPAIIDASDSRACRRDPRARCSNCSDRSWASGSRSSQPSCSAATRLAWRDWLWRPHPSRRWQYRCSGRADTKSPASAPGYSAQHHRRAHTGPA